MKLVTPTQMSAIEDECQRDFEISDELLMESAGALAAREVRFSFLPELAKGNLAVICGPGNNGGDGLVLARHLHSQGFSKIKVFYIGKEANHSRLFKSQLQKIQKINVDSLDIGMNASAIKEFKEFGLIVDALFGVGLSRPLSGQFLEIVQGINSSKVPVVSLDIPSGLSSLTGEALGGAVYAKMTLTFGLGKPGLFLADGPKFSGAVRVLQIGFPQSLLEKHAGTHSLIEEKEIKKFILSRAARSHKANHGHLLAIAGSPGMWGAAGLCCEGAFRVGAGYVTLAIEQSISNSNSELGSIYKESGLEVITTNRSDPVSFEKKTAVVLGPGVGDDDSIKKIILKLIELKMSKVLLDADALTVLSKMGKIALPNTWLLTPHSGELGRLLIMKSELVESDRMTAALKASEKYQCLVLLKGYRTVLANPQGQISIISSGNSSLAKAGTGDVLSGFIGGLMAQNLSTHQAAALGAYLHGRIADDWVRAGNDAASLMPRDILAAVPRLLSHLRSGDLN